MPFGQSSKSMEARRVSEAEWLAIFLCSSPPHVLHRARKRHEKNPLTTSIVSERFPCNLNSLFLADASGWQKRRPTFCNSRGSGLHCQRVRPAPLPLPTFFHSIFMENRYVGNIPQGFVPWSYAT